MDEDEALLELIEAANDALPYVNCQHWDKRHYTRLMKAVIRAEAKMREQMPKTTAGDWEAEAEKRRGRPLGGRLEHLNAWPTPEAFAEFERG